MSFEEDAQPFEFEILPGLFTEKTERGSSTRWKDGDKVRFKNGLPQKLGGWALQALTGATITGVPRRTHEWQALDRTKIIAVGTNAKLYVLIQNVAYDITPIRRQKNLAANPFSFQNGLPTVTVTDVGHGAIQGDYVTFTGATAAAGLTITGEYKIQSIVGVDSYTITASGNANTTTTGGGSNVLALYDINNGGEDTGLYYGYGVCTYGGSTYGTPRGACSTMVRNLRIWSLDNWGEDLIASPREGEVYVWDRTLGTSTRAQLIAGAPRTNQRVLVSSENRQLICLGASSLSGSPDPLLIRVSDNEDYETFVSDDSNNVYTKRIDRGSKIITGFVTRSSTLVFTDVSVHLMQATGDENVYEVRLLSEGNSIIGPNAGGEVNGIGYWMSGDKFMRFDGVVQELACDVWTRVFGSLNVAQKDKVYFAHNEVFPEITWYYPSGGSGECDRYVTYNYTEGHWTFGTMNRTAASAGKSQFYNKPIAFNSSGVLYRHEDGVDDHTSGMSAFVESGDLVLGNGRQQMHVSRFVPDNFSLVGTLSLTIKTKRRPEDAAYRSFGPYSITTGTVEQGVRARGRQCAVRFETSALSANWKLGPYTFYAQEDGER